MAMYWNKVAIAALAAIGLVGCEPTDPSADTLPAFGASVATNNAVQIGYAVTGPGFEELSARFIAQVDDTINFEFNSAALTPQAQITLTQQAAWLRRNPQARLRVEGHTDLVGGENYNLQLGLRRAESAVSFLVSSGIRRDRLDAIATFGEQMPVVQTTQRELLNRRAVTRVAGIAIGPAQGDFDGKRADTIYDVYTDRPAARLEMGGTGGGSGGGAE